MSRKKEDKKLPQVIGVFSALKILEVAAVFLYLKLGYLYGVWIASWYPGICDGVCSTWEFYVFGPLYLLFTIMIVILLGYIGYGIFQPFIKLNWKWANKLVHSK